MLNFPQKGRGLGHVVTPKIFGIRSNISSKLLELGTSNLEKPIGRANNFPRKGRVLGHVTPKIFGIRLNISSKRLELETLNLVHGFLLEKFSAKGAWPRSRDPSIFGIQSNISSKLLQLETSPYLWNQLPSSFRQPHCVHSPPGSPHTMYHLITVIAFVLTICHFLDLSLQT